MPTLVRFLTIVGAICAAIAAVTFVLATEFEPSPRQETKVVPGIKIRK